MMMVDDEVRIVSDGNAMPQRPEQIIGILGRAERRASPEAPITKPPGKPSEGAIIG